MLIYIITSYYIDYTIILIILVIIVMAFMFVLILYYYCKCALYYKYLIIQYTDRIS